MKEKKYGKIWVLGLSALCVMLVSEEPKEEPPRSPPAPPRIITQAPIFIPQWLSRMNTNQDSKITLEEFSKYFHEHFQKANTNKDGFMEKSEYEKYMEDLKQKYLDNAIKSFEKQDKDSDGRLSKEEARVNEKRFAELDVDKDGYISKEEAEKAYNLNWIGYYNNYLHDFPNDFPIMDKNSDGKVEIGELDARIDFQFSWFDKNGDRAISSADVEKKTPAEQTGEKKSEEKKTEGTKSS